jgi:hypothetical protein
MGEPRRWEITGHAEGYPRVDGSFHNPIGHGETVRVREDRATEVDREKIARRLAEYAAHELGLEIEILDHHYETADELLALVFGEEVSRV